MPVLAAFFNDLDPVLIGPFFGSLAIRWYGLAYVAGFACAWIVMSQLAKRGLIGIPRERVGDAIMTLIVGTIVGGRIGYALFYRPSLFIEFDNALPFWGLLKIHQGGMASHGGMIGLAVAAWWVARRHALPTLHVVDVLCLTGPIGIVFVRTANFINGELLGRVVAQPGEKAPWWAVKYPTELLERPMNVADPEQREARLWRLVESNNLILPGETADDAIRRLLEQIRAGNDKLIQQVEPLITARHPTQFYQAFAEGVLILIVLWSIWSVPRRPGIIAAWFFSLYGVGRIITEIWRLPDADIPAPIIAGLSRGQWLSVGLVIVGLALFASVRRKDAEPVGGWRRRNPVWNERAEKRDDARGAPSP